MLINFFLVFSIFVFLTFSVIGYGKTIIKLTGSKDQFIINYKSIFLLQGLIFSGLVATILSLFISISDNIVFIFLILGIIAYLINGIHSNFELKEIKTLFFLSFFSSIVAFYSLNNDDFHIHIRSISTFKNIGTLPGMVDLLLEGNRVAYNSHWLIINAILSFKNIPQSIYFLNSILYSFILFDFYKKFKKQSYDNMLLKCYSLFVLIFILGVLNTYKDIGTDFPGQFIILFLFLIFIETNFGKKILDNKVTFLIIFQISLLTIMIKISNILILIPLLIMFLRIKYKLRLIIYIFLLSIPFYFWILQNFLHSGCLIWPIQITCFENSDFHSKIYSAKNEIMIIQYFAKSVLGIVPIDMNANNLTSFFWVKNWIFSHLPKILEVFGYYVLIILSVPLTMILFGNKNNRTRELIGNKLKFINYKTYSLISLILIIIWFLQAPAYRFGFAYILNFIIIFLTPVWYLLILNYRSIAYKSSNVLILIAFIFFVYNNISKSLEYISREGLIWPNIVF